MFVISNYVRPRLTGEYLNLNYTSLNNYLLFTMHLIIAKDI